MKLLKAKYIILTKINGNNILTHLEAIGRTAYKSEDKITHNSSKEFIKMIIDRGHLSVIEHFSFSVKFITDRGISHELVRHRLASFTQESTRYCNYSKDKHGNELNIIIPSWFTEDDIETLKNNNFTTDFNKDRWHDAMLDAEEHYIQLINNGWTPQQARSVLPNSLKTEIIITANLREWRLILTQRTAKSAHPQVRELMCPLLDELKNLIPIIFDDINY